METISHLLCTHTGTPSKMFVEAESCKVINESKYQYTIIDCLGHLRVVSKDTLRFIIGHDSLERPLYARFKPVRCADGETKEL